MGDILRAEAKNTSSPWAEQIHQHMRDGALVGHELCVDLLLHHVSSMTMEDDETLLLDGFPRSIEQAIQFAKKVRRPRSTYRNCPLIMLKGGRCWAAVSLDCLKEVMLERLVQRQRLLQRMDDQVDIFETRYDGYIKESLPVVEHLRSGGARIISVRLEGDRDRRNAG